ncbi:glutathione S-transferase family protein [Marimonas arenosa]|uniref:Glutathione S-transferase n=1 Tax=Marimonas arenosa TaxID=1795305 RepID=A0AAE3WCJ7_9RHOB|nr:glutathione S-transferase family protein [Marimonas arenosa]MDQ2090461.1 glutathione S-transferase [Marimonas arenosa]
MRLYYTPNSPYARMVRVAARESGLRPRIEEIEVSTRDPESNYFAVTPLARVPVVEDGGAVIADTRDICAHFDALEGRARWLPPEDDAARLLRNIAFGFLDGVAVWLRENVRPKGQKSGPVMAYEEHRTRNVLGWLEPRFRGEGRWDFTALALACAVDIGRSRGMAEGWSEIAPGLMDWAGRRAGCPFMAETAPGAP